MIATALRPRSVTEIVDASFQLLRQHYGSFVMCSTIAYAPQLIVKLLLVGDPQRFATLDPSVALDFAWVTLVSTSVALVTYSMMSAVMTTCASQAYLGQPVDVAVAVRQTARRLPAVMLSSLLTFALFFGALLLLLVPAVYVTARFFAVTSAIILENRGVSDAFARSGELSRGRKWHILNAFGLVVLIYFVVFFGITLLGTMFGGFVLQTALAAVVTICLYPVIAIANVLLYYDARVQSEGLDLELMADALPARSPSAA